MCTPLLNHLKSKQLLHQTRGLAQWKAISWWCKNTREGHEQLALCGLTPDNFALHHVVPQNLRGPSVVYNCAFGSTGANGHLGDRWDAEVRRYHGALTINIAMQSLKFATDTEIDWEPFSKNQLTSAIAEGSM